MNASWSRFPTQLAACVAVAGFALAASKSAQSEVSPPTTVVAPAQGDVPDGSPQLAQEKVISNTSTGTTGGANPGKSASSVIVNEERIQGRLASAHVSVGGTKGYTVVDPDAGRSDRRSDNGGKRLSPSIWELFRF